MSRGTDAALDFLSALEDALRHPNIKPEVKRVIEEAIESNA
jgi:hypothetical protein